MNFRSRKFLLLVVFGITLLGSVFGWLWVIQRLVDSDAIAADARVKEAEQRYLREIPIGFDSSPFFVDGQVPDWATSYLVKSRSMAGVWTEHFNVSMKPLRPVKRWPVGDEVTSSEELLQREGEFPWGHVEDGRDRLGVLLLKLARQEGEKFKGLGMIKLGYMNSYQPGRSMSSGFRLLLLREILRKHPSSDYQRYMLAEEIRAVEGRVEELETPLEALSDNGVTVFFSRDQMIRWIAGSRATDFDLTAQPPEDATWIKVPGFNHWPYLSLKSGLAGEKASVRESQRAVKTVGLLTVLSTLGVILASIWLGRRELMLARSRTDLAASVAHELRTPLAGQRVVLENLENRLSRASAQDQGSVKMALRENLRLGDLAESFLTFSKLDRGILKIDRHPVFLHQVVEQVMERFEPHWGADDVVKVEVDPLIPTALADEAGVGTVLRNLVENAWKYSENPRRVTVRLIETEREVGLSVTDQGSGLSRRDQLLIFNQFYQVDRRLDRSQGGLGLGLSIVKRLMDGMSGRTEIESELGSGTTFKIYFEKGEKS